MCLNLKKYMYAKRDYNLTEFYSIILIIMVSSGAISDVKDVKCTTNILSQLGLFLGLRSCSNLVRVW